jgi:hypothetical protein
VPNRFFVDIYPSNLDQIPKGYQPLIIYDLINQMLVPINPGTGLFVTAGKIRCVSNASHPSPFGPRSPAFVLDARSPRVLPDKSITKAALAFYSLIIFLFVLLSNWHAPAERRACSI